jgi:hypothetical protein
VAKCARRRHNVPAAALFLFVPPYVYIICERARECSGSEPISKSLCRSSTHNGRRITYIARALCRQEKDNVRQGAHYSCLLLVVRACADVVGRITLILLRSRIREVQNTRSTRHDMLHHIGLILLDFFVLQYDARPQQNCTFEAPALYLTRVCIVLLYIVIYKM